MLAGFVLRFDRARGIGRRALLLVACFQRLYALFQRFDLLAAPTRPGTAPALDADLKALAAAEGRNPKEVLILPGLSAMIGSTEAEAQRLAREIIQGWNDYLALGKRGSGASSRTRSSVSRMVVPSCGALPVSRA